MPEMDGYEATRRIRALPRFAEIPIIAMTANVMADDVRACLCAGMNDHIAKPIDVPEMVRILRRWLDGHDSASAV
jgi:CheY-like chemotaxis protein